LPLSKNIETSACLAGSFFFPPLYIKLADFSARRALDDDFPSTNVSASRIFDLPDPFGPSTTLNASLNVISVLFAKLLNPCSTSLLIFVISIHHLYLIYQL